MKILGIDVSKHQGNFDFKNAKEKGVQFAILRGGYTGSTTGKNYAKDEKYEKFYKECKELNIPIGAYWYSRATSYDLGVKEATYMYENCLKGKTFEYPIYIDVEDTKYQAKASKDKIDEAIKGFCDYLEGKGYYVGIYASDISGFKQMMNLDNLKKYDKWVARYGSEPTYVKEYGMWQFSSKNGVISGASDSLDLDYCYKDYPSIIKKKGLNGYAKTTKTETKTETKVDSKYYKKYTGKSSSIVVALNSLGIKSSFTNRYKIANKNGIKLYIGTSKQNTKLLDLLKKGKLLKI